MKDIRIEIQVNAIRGDESEMIYNSVTFLRANAVVTTDLVSMAQLDAVSRSVGGCDGLSVGILLAVDEKTAASLLGCISPRKLVPSVCNEVARKATKIGLFNSLGGFCETR
jgi:hypothetical protein